MIDPKVKTLVRLVHWLSSGRTLVIKGEPWHEVGMSYAEVIKMLNHPIKQKGGMTALECVEIEGDKFVNELIEYVQEREE